MHAYLRRGLEVALMVGGGVLFFAGHASAADGTTGVRKALGPKHYEGDDQYDDKLERSDARHEKPPGEAQRGCAERVTARVKRGAMSRPGPPGTGRSVAQQSVKSAVLHEVCAAGGFSDHRSDRLAHIHKQRSPS